MAAFKKIILFSATLVFIFLGKSSEAMIIKSPAFAHNGNIPTHFTCQGKDISPALQWSEIPSSTKSLVLIVDDPDATKGTWTHWVVYNIPPNVTEFSEGESQGEGGLNSWGKTGYGGPCPPSGTHRYFFKLYALDIVLPMQQSPTLKNLIKAMEGHILNQAELVGKYSKE